MLNGAKVRNLWLVLAVAGATVLAACAQTAPRNAPTATSPAPQPTASATPAPSPAPTQTPYPPTATPTAAPEPSPTATPQLSPSPTATSTNTPVSLPTVIPVNNVQTYTLTLEIEGLSDESIVRGDSIVARGQTSPDAIVSINGVIVPVDDNGHFEVPMMLDPGPNVIEVVASDLDGNQVSTVLAVVSLPEEGA